MTENKITDDQYNADELVAPKWLNTEFITEVLSKYKKEPKLKVLDLKISPASGKSDHYASVMFRASVDYETEKGKFSKSLIVKTMPEQDGYKKDILSDSHLFETEIGMYSQVLPKFEKILQDVGDKTKLHVPCIYYSLQPRRILIFDDLVPLGYSVMRNREPTVEELKCPLEKLAKWHAVSIKVLNEQPDFLKEYKHGLIEMPNISDMINLGIDNFLEMLIEQPDLIKYKTYFEKIKVDYLEQLKNYLAEYRNHRRDTYYVLSHGDFHLRFQVSNLCPISVDTVYSIYMLMGPEQRLNDWKVFFYFVENIKGN